MMKPGRAAFQEREAVTTPRATTAQPANRKAPTGSAMTK